jgi:hypothetical protein
VTEKNFTVEQVKAALLAVRDKITPAQLLMLKGHYGCRIASMGKIAAFGGYGENFKTANIQYGGLCGRLAEHLGFTPEGKWSKTFTIATVLHDQPDETGNAKWRMDDVVATALEELGWVTRSTV